MKLLTEEEIIESKRAYSYIKFDADVKKGGVYFLINGSEEIGYSVSYVGKSGCMISRIRNHVGLSGIPFTRYSYIVTNDYDNGFMEQMYIASLIPMFNIGMGSMFLFTKNLLIKKLSNLGFTISKDQMKTIIKKFSLTLGRKQYIIGISALIFLGVKNSDIMDILGFIQK